MGMDEGCRTDLSLSQGLVGRHDGVASTSEGSEWPAGIASSPVLRIEERGVK